MIGGQEAWWIEWEQGRGGGLVEEVWRKGGGERGGERGRWWTRSWNQLRVQGGWGRSGGGGVEKWCGGGRRGWCLGLLVG